MSKGKGGIEVFVRVRPTKRPSKGLTLLPDENKVEFKFSKDGILAQEVRHEQYNF